MLAVLFNLRTAFPSVTTVLNSYITNSPNMFIYSRR